MTMEKGGKVINNMTIPKNRMERKKCDIYIPVLPCIQQTNAPNLPLSVHSPHVVSTFPTLFHPLHSFFNLPSSTLIYPAPTEANLYANKKMAINDVHARLCAIIVILYERIDEGIYIKTPQPRGIAQ